MTSDEFTEQLGENLRKWFKEKWVRFGPDGKIRGACARGDDSEGKPKCLPQKKAQNLGKKGRKYAASKKRREDPNPERSGKAKNVATKKKTNEDIPFNECPSCRGPIVHESMMNEKQDACYHKVKSRYKVWPSAYASGALVQCRKKGASNWGTGGKKTESSIMKGIVDESESVLVLYIDGKPSAKYAIGHEAKTAMERLQAKFPNRTFELKRETRGGIGGNKKVDEAGNPAQQAAIAISKKERGEKPKNEASGTPGGLERYRTPAMVNATMQQSLYKRELAPIKAAEKKRKEAEYRKNNPSVSVPSIQIGATNYPIPVIQSWIDNKDLNAALEFAVNKFAYKQSKDFKTELAGDPNFQNAIKNFFNVAEKSLNNRNSTRTKSRWDGKIRAAHRETDISSAGFDAVNKINDALLPYYKKYGVDKTGRRVPPGFNYNLEEAKAKQYVKPYNSPQTGEQIGWVSSDGYHKKYWQMFAKDSAIKHAKLNPDEVQENAWNQLGQQRPSKNLPAPEKGSVPKHDRHFEEGEIVIPMSGPMAGKPHRVVHSQSTSIRIVPVGRNEYPGDIIGPRTKHEWVVPADMNEDYTGEFAAEKTPAINPYGGLKDNQFRGGISEDTAYAGGMGQGGNAGESYRKFKPKSAGTFKEEQLDEKCWDTHKQVGMKNKGGRQVPNCVPKESAIMKGLKR